MQGSVNTQKTILQMQNLSDIYAHIFKFSSTNLIIFSFGKLPACKMPKVICFVIFAHKNMNAHIAWYT